MRRKPPSLYFQRGNRRDQSPEMAALHDTLHYDYVIDDAIFTTSNDYHYEDDYHYEEQIDD